MDQKTQLPASDPVPQAPVLTPVGVTGALVRFGHQMSAEANRAALAFHAHLQAEPIEGVLETAPSLVSVFLRFDPMDEGSAQLLDAIAQVMQARDWSAEAARHATPARRWTVPCCFDGPQLQQAAELAGLSEAQAIAELQASDVTVLTLGFAPGQPYMGTLPSHWDIARLKGIAPQVPQGAVVVAVRQLIIFANASPTGWRHVANSAFKCFDPRRAEPFALRPGDALRFRAIGRGELDALYDAADGLGGAVLEATQ